MADNEEAEFFEEFEFENEFDKVEELALASKSCFISDTSPMTGKFNEWPSIIDGSSRTCWISKAIFPQHITLSFPNEVQIFTIKMTSYKVKTVCVERSVSPNLQESEFEVITEKDIAPTDGLFTTTTFWSKKILAHHLRFTIKSSHDIICAIQKVEVLGKVWPHVHTMEAEDKEVEEQVEMLRSRGIEIEEPVVGYTSEGEPSGQMEEQPSTSRQGQQTRVYKNSDSEEMKKYLPPGSEVAPHFSYYYDGPE